jgi:uncharacterized protein HemX
MSKQRTRRRRAAAAAAQTVALGVAVAALVAILGAGQALAGPDERVLERQSRIDHQLSVGQAADQGKTEKSSQQKAAEVPRRFIRPEPPMDTSPRLDAEQQVPPTPAPSVPADSRAGLAVALAVAALLLAVGGAATWWIHHRRPQPESTA